MTENASHIAIMLLSTALLAVSIYCAVLSIFGFYGIGNNQKQRKPTKTEGRLNVKR